MKRKIFLYGYYGFNNFGDDLILRSLIENIMSYGKTEFLVRSLNKGPYLGENVVYTKVDKIIANSKVNRAYRLVKYLKKILLYVKKTDFVIVGGGTLIHDNKSRWSLLIIFLLVISSKILFKRIFFVGIGISDLKYKSSYIMLNLITKLSSGFYIRDIEAEKILRKANVVEKRFQLTADLAYSLKHLKKKSDKTGDNKRINIGITVVDNAFYNKKIQGAIIEYVALLKNISYEFEVHFIPFHEMSVDCDNTINDSKVMIKIKQELSEENIIIEEQIGEKFDKVYESLDLVIGMRFHSLVLAAIYEIPFIGINHDNKIVGICKSYDMPSVDVKDVNAEILLETTKNTLKKYFPTETNLEMRKRSLKNFDFLEEFYGRNQI
ncbi:polysaccharide pyruvyl transferase family protein [uncultured Phascolarctobacterium sp.]|uniref:polysaccharide pyruvyl transferase family protein n=1 Tax=uncultured Phascolarctobacterium sp. TaxID=512296 RepID=UPI0027D96DA2|nr:polysaccharide pyruvyl transferase family protein [uncultured Phascolarctobacterium sp.]